MLGLDRQDIFLLPLDVLNANALLATTCPLLLLVMLAQPLTRLVPAL